MSNFIEELYYGNLDPQARKFRKESGVIKLADNINELEETLAARLNDEEKKIFYDFCDANMEMMGTSCLDAFTVGFRLGARMTIDTFCSDDAPFESI